jgi:hypothetical protein
MVYLLVNVYSNTVKMLYEYAMVADLFFFDDQLKY